MPNQYITNLSGHEQENIKFTPSNNFYRFAGRPKVKAIQNITSPALIGNEHINIQSNIIDNDIPLLFSRSSMKKAQMKINFQNDTINAFGENIPLITTTSGHYAIPLTQAKQVTNNIDRES